MRRRLLYQRLIGRLGFRQFFQRAQQVLGDFQATHDPGLAGFDFLDVKS
jgi:hypothetical protein